MNLRRNFIFFTSSGVCFCLLAKTQTSSFTCHWLVKKLRRGNEVMRFSCVVASLRPRTFFPESKRGRKKERKVWGMEKIVVFDERDKSLVERIEVFQKESGKNFGDAIKELCEIALKKTQNMKWGTF